MKDAMISDKESLASLSHVERALCCVVCHGELVQPLTLPCLHSCCRSCAATIVVPSPSTSSAAIGVAAAATGSSVAPPDKTAGDCSAQDPAAASQSFPGILPPSSGTDALSAASLPALPMQAQPSRVIVRCPRCADAWPDGLAAAAAGTAAATASMHELPAADSSFLSSLLTLRKVRSQPAVCAVCTEEGVRGVAAAVRCMQCQKYLCSPCIGMHSRFLRWHTTVPVEQFRCAPLSLQDGPAPRSCCTHSGASGDLSFYCNTCADTKCVDCLVSTCHKRQHDYVPLSTHVGKLRNQISESLDVIDKRFPTLDRVRERCRDVLRVLADQKDDALAALAANKRRLLLAVDACHREVEGRLRAECSALTESVRGVDDHCRSLREAMALSAGYGRLLLEHGHHLHILDQSVTAEQCLQRIAQPEAVAGVACPSLPSMAYDVATPDLAAIKLWLGVPHWTMDTEDMFTAVAGTHQATEAGTVADRESTESLDLGNRSESGHAIERTDSL